MKISKIIKIFTNNGLKSIDFYAKIMYNEYCINKGASKAAFETERKIVMTKKLLALLLALLTVASLSACKKENEDEGTDLDDFRKEDVVYTSITDETTKSVFHFELMDTETVAITGYEGPTELHNVTVPSVVYTGEDKETSKKDVVAIAAEAFKNVSSIQNIIIPEGITSIGKYAFAYCAHLETVKFPSTLKTIDEGAFYQSGLTSLTFPEACDLTELKMATFSKCNSLKEVTIPGYIKTVGMAAFFECASLEKVTLSEGVVTVGKLGFQGCPSFKELNLPSTLTNTDPFEDLAFLGSDVLYIENVKIPENLPEESTLRDYVKAMENYLKEAPEQTA